MPIRKSVLHKSALMLLAAAVLSGCVTPSFDPVGARTELAPWQVVEQSLDNIDVIWGGAIIKVHHYETDSEIEVLAYPLDQAQRPLPRAPSQGRFRIRLPGYVEAVDFPEGLFLSARGRLIGTRAGSIGNANYVYPIITDAHIKRWPPGFQFDRSHWSIGVGVIL